MRGLFEDFNIHKAIAEWAGLMSMLRLANGTQQHRSGGQRARRDWKRNRAAGVAK